jgi:hypothetical protein
LKKLAFFHFANVAAFSRIGTEGQRSVGFGTQIPELVPMAFRAWAILAALIALATWPAQGPRPFPPHR